MVATVSTVYPGFLIGALTVQVSDEFSVTEATYGWGLGGFFWPPPSGRPCSVASFSASGPVVKFCRVWW